MKKERPESAVGILRIKLGASLVGPTKRLVADLHSVALAYNAACTHMLRCWERWCEDNKADPSAKKIDYPKGFGKLLYHYGRSKARQIAAKSISSGVQEVLGNKQLRKRMPYNHTGKARYMWQAILLGEASRPTYRGLRIPVQSQDTTIVCEPGRSTLTFPLFSKDAGREITSVTCRIETRQMSPGQRRIIGRVAREEEGWSLCDSQLVWKEGKGRRHGRQEGSWFFNMAYRQPREALRLNPQRKAVLSMTSDKDRPFQIVCDKAIWMLGDARVLEANYRRLDERRQEMRRTYRLGGSGERGHGRERIERPMRPITRRLKHLVERAIKNIVADVLKFCIRQDCGAVEYLEPSFALRNRSWFAKKGVAMDWTNFRALLHHKLTQLHDVALTVIRQKKSDGGENAGIAACGETTHSRASAAK